MESQLRTFMNSVAQSLGKSPQDLEPFIKILEDNWFNTTDDLKAISNEQWHELKIPMGLINAIKKKLADVPQPEQKPPTSQLQQQNSSLSDVPMQIDTSGSPSTQQFQQQQQQQYVSKEDMVKSLISEQCLVALSSLKDMELPNNMAQHRQTIDTLFKIVANLLQNSLDPQVRRFKKSNKAIQAKILAFQNAVGFLQIIGFNFEQSAEEVILTDYKKEVLEGAIEAINLHITSLGGHLEQPNKFNPYQAQMSSTTGELKLPPNQAQVTDRYNPSIVTSEIDKIKQQQREILKQEGRVQERNVMVFNAQHSGQNLKSFLMDLEQKEYERLKELNINEEKLDEAIGNTQALKFMAENAENMKFKNKRQDELTKIQKQKVYPTTLVRIRFPDDYCIQGTFGALERFEEVHKYVQENLYIKDRPFYLYTVPPKKEVRDMKSSLLKLKMVPSQMLYFGWEDLEQTKNTDGPFLDIASLQSKIISF